METSASFEARSAPLLYPTAVAFRPQPTVASQRVGIATGGYSAPYDAVQRAIAFSGNFPSVLGKTVVIKPNLVGPQRWDTGITTHPEMVRKVVDICLSRGASAVKIIEGGRLITPGVGGAFFSQCGYDFFEAYHPRVSLVDISLESCSLALVPQVSGAPAAYRGIYIPTTLLSPDTVFISMGKLKTHSECGATLSTKNLFGLPPVGPYIVPAMEGWRPRYKLHDRGVSQAIVDICLARPIHYAVIDGGVGMEGDGPTDGLPRLCDLVIAGANHVAVDRTALQIMGIPQHKCQHLDYAYLRGLGPYSLDAGQVQIVGDSLPAMSPFLYPTGVPPRIWYPVGTPNPLPKGQMATIRFRLTDPAETKVEIVTVSDESPAITVLRTISDWSFTNSGLVQTSWDCRDANGALVPTPTAPTSYGIRVQARHPGMTRVSRMINWLPVMP